MARNFELNSFHDSNIYLKVDADRFTRAADGNFYFFRNVKAFIGTDEEIVAIVPAHPNTYVVERN